ncbi:MAG: transglutaminase-like domain-containing protein, partial [Pyrinomonadaceae bacterium]
PREAYLQMRAGAPVLCGNLADIYVGLAQAAGLTARTVNLGLMIRDERFGADTHVTTEVWLPEFGGWVIQDPTFNCHWEVDGKPASALTLHQALMDHRSIARGPREQPAETELLNYYIDPRLFFSHLFYEYRVGGELLYYLDQATEPIDPRESNWIQSDDEGLFEGLELAPTEIDLVQGEIAPGIFVQMIKGTLYVRDRRPLRRGIRVRSTRGPVQACAYVHGRAETSGIFDRPNFVRNASFQRASRSEQVADNWNVEGPIEGLTISGGQGVGAGPGGQLFQTFRVEPNRSYVMYALVNVLRGRLEWRLTDLVGRHESKGRLDPGRIEEVLSDAVVSDDSGQLRVEFTVPDGGAFRVLDVIVCKLPRGNAVQSDLVIRR